ncbi:hypothetical protein PSTT_15302 [Puccinia striiformis]|uniref:J domain-containing protein n=1 Tax=Puccinia striiformis TaxID=27350 RepID=A0A2S4UII0_9BASI|nr:hypothetical protein PSTT_15302 [Puccinia striiformis]
MASAYIAHLGDLSTAFSFFGWWFLPGYASSIVLGIFYRIFPSRRPPLPGSAYLKPGEKPVYNPVHELQKVEHDRRSRHHRSIAHGLVIGLYLGYTLVGEYRKQTGRNYYSILGIQSNSLAFNSTTSQSIPENLNQVRSQIIKGDLLDEAALKSHWRKLARSFHPDKLNPPASLKTEFEISQWKSNVESKFIQMREAYETLNDNTKQWAYDRFGPSVTQWKNCITLREYLIEGIKHTSPFYALSGSSLLVIGTVRKSDAGTFQVKLMRAVLEYYTYTVAMDDNVTGHWIRSDDFDIDLTDKGQHNLGDNLSIPEELKKDKSLESVIEPLFGLVDQIHESSNLANVELIKLMFNDLHPIIKNSTDDKNKSDHHLTTEEGELESNQLSQSQQNLKMQKVISEVKSKMLDTFCDLKLQSDPDGQAAWIQAIQDEKSTE